jgi:hypothetical protein
MSSWKSTARSITVMLAPTSLVGMHSVVGSLRGGGDTRSRPIWMGNETRNKSSDLYDHFLSLRTGMTTNTSLGTAGALYSKFFLGL